MSDSGTFNFYDFVNNNKKFTPAGKGLAGLSGLVGKNSRSSQLSIGGIAESFWEILGPKAPRYQVWITFDTELVTNAFEIVPFDPYDKSLTNVIDLNNLARILDSFYQIKVMKRFSFLKWSDLATISLMQSKKIYMQVHIGYRSNFMRKENAIERIEFETTNINIKTIRISNDIGFDGVTLVFPETYTSIGKES